MIYLSTSAIGLYRQTHPTLLPPSREDKSKPLGAETKEDEDDQPHPGIEQSEHWIEVWHLLAGELDVGRVGECPDHAEQEVGDGQALALHLEILHHILLPGLRCARVEDDNTTQYHSSLNLLFYIFLNIFCFFNC